MFRNLGFVLRKRKESLSKSEEKEEKERFLPFQATDSFAVSNHDLPGKGAKLGYYILVHDYVYVLVVFLMCFLGFEF